MLELPAEVFRDKTGNKFVDVFEFKKKPYKYNLMDQYEEVDDGPAQQQLTQVGTQVVPVSATSSETLALEQPVVDIIMKIFDAKEIIKTMEAIGLNATKLPLGLVSTRTIRKAYTTLSQIAQILAK